VQTVDDAAAAPFVPDQALVQLKRALRELRQLNERGNRYELKGLVVLELECSEHALTARLAKRPARTPEWERFTLGANPDLRRFGDEIKKRLARWTDDER
jgi:hypothetical protein